MSVTLRYTDNNFEEKTKTFDLGGGTEINTFLAGLQNVSYFHNTTNMIWRIHGTKDGGDMILGYFVTDRNKHHRYATQHDTLQLAQLQGELYATGEKFDSLNVDSLDFLKMFNSIKESDQRVYKKPQKEIKKLDRIISEKAFFGCGYRVVGDKKQYYAWHGLPNRNDDYITTAEISEAEYRMIESEYPSFIEATKEQAALFRKKYVHAHKVLLEGWNELI